MRPEPLPFALGIFALGMALVLYMGWLGSADIAHREFDFWVSLIAAALLLWRSISGIRKSAGTE